MRAGVAEQNHTSAARRDARAGGQLRELLDFPRLAGFALLAAGLVSCSEDAVHVDVRSLEQSGEVAFACLAWDDVEQPGRMLDRCRQGDNTGELFAFVTQETRGEVAVINVTRDTVVDLNPAKPGYSFLPVGASPTSIVATPGGTALFVGSASANQFGIWTLPARKIVQGNPHLTLFAACSLPAAPGQMAMIRQPLGASQTSSRCDGQAYDSAGRANGDLSVEGGLPGVQKLVVSLPDLGSIAVLDAQQLLDQPAGSVVACPIERMVSLRADVPASPPSQRVTQGNFAPGTTASGQTCSLTAPANSLVGTLYAPRPARMTYDADTDRLFVADESAPVIHVLDARAPCELTETAPLLTMSADEPSRTVVSRFVAVSPPTSQGKKYLYANDLSRGSLMVFDVSLDSTDRTPLMRPFAWQDPFQPIDRLAFSAPVRDVAFLRHDQPATNPSTGATAVGIACDPSDNDAFGARYRWKPDTAQGASPMVFRGVFANVALTNGRIAVVDVDDFDANCRRPKTKGLCAGDEARGFSSYEGASGELSCNVVTAHQSRSSYRIAADDRSMGRVTGLQAYPALTMGLSNLPTDQSPEGLRTPKLLPPQQTGTTMLVGGREATDITSDPGAATKNMVLLDQRQPRVHGDEAWAVVFEGSIPGFDQHYGRFDTQSDPWGRTTFYDAGAFFCDRGVHDQDAVKALHATQDPAMITSPATWPMDHADVLQITEDFLDSDSDYWNTVAGQCSWRQCRETFGVVSDPKAPRDLPIVKAYQGSLVVDGVFDFVRCCFPTVVSYAVRPRNQWIVVGSVSGFLHHVVADPQTGQCIDSCDPNRMLLNGRAFERPQGTGIPAMDDPSVFRNPMMQFVVWSGQQPSMRSMAFEFTQRDGFVPMMVSIGGSSTFVQPRSIAVAPTGELVVVDASAQGLVFVDMGALQITRWFY